MTDDEVARLFNPNPNALWVLIKPSADRANETRTAQDVVTVGKHGRVVIPVFTHLNLAEQFAEAVPQLAGSWTERQPTAGKFVGMIEALQAGGLTHVSFNPVAGTNPILVPVAEVVSTIRNQLG